MRSLEWNYHIEELERMAGFVGLEKDEARGALKYLKRVLGEEFLARASAREPCVARHPLLRLLANFAPCSRRDISRFADYLRVLEGSKNLESALARLHNLSQFEHDALLIKAAAKLVSEGLRARFEPTRDVGDRRRQPDLRLEDPVTGEETFVEVTTQNWAKRERETTEASSAISSAVFDISYELCYTGRWQQTPTKQSLGDLVERVKVDGKRVLSERTIVHIEEPGILDMALCHRDDRQRLLDPWSTEMDLLSGGFQGPVMKSNHTFRLRVKIGKEQVQLPSDTANVIVVLAGDVFLLAGGVGRVVSEVEAEVVKYDHVHLVVVHGEYVDDSEVAFAAHKEEYRYTRRVVEGTVENDLLLVNRHSRMKLSDSLFATFCRVF